MAIEIETSTAPAPLIDNAMDMSTTELTSDQVIAKIDELVNVAHFLRRVAKPMVKKYGKKRVVRKDSSAVKRNGFAVPVTMADRLVEFLNTNFNMDYTQESIVPRTQVTSLITQYIKDHDLQVADNRKNFVLDKALCTVFNTPEGTLCNWFQLQKHMKDVVKSEKSTDAEKKRSADDAEIASTSAAAAPAPTPASAPAPAPASAPPPAAPAPSNAAEKAPPKRIKRSS